MDDVERLVIVEDIRHLMARYVRHADHQRWTDLAGLFTPDGIFTPHKPDGSVWLRLRGRAEIAAAPGGSSGPGDVYVHHLLSAEIDVASADAATGVFAMADRIYRAAGNARGATPGERPFTRMTGYGHYHGEFTRIGGTCHIARLTRTRLRLDFTYQQEETP